MHEVVRRAAAARFDIHLQAVAELLRRLHEELRVGGEEMLERGEVARESRPRRRMPSSFGVELRDGVEAHRVQLLGRDGQRRVCTTEIPVVFGAAGVLRETDAAGRAGAIRAVDVGRERLELPGTMSEVTIALAAACKAVRSPGESACKRESAGTRASLCGGCA